MSLCLLQISASSQNHYFEKDVDEQIENEDEGPNTGFANFINFGYGVIIPNSENDSMSINYGDGLRFGNLYLWNIKKRFGAGFNLDLYYQSYNIKQDSAKNLYSLGFENEKQRLSMFKVDLAPVIRIKYGKGGNGVGKYIDLGGYGSVNFSYTEFLRNDLDPKLNKGAEQSEVYLKKLKYLERFEYGLSGQLGFKNFVIWGRYRVSDMFKEYEGVNNGNQLPDLPRLTVGIGFSSWSN